MKLVNPAGRTRTASIAAKGLEMASSAARVITLGHHDPAIENTIDEPGLIIPRLSQSRVTGGSLILALKPHSLTVARIRVKGNWQTAYTRLG